MYFMFDRYSVSSCHHREKNTSSARHSRATGPAPSCAPSSNAERNMAKFSEMRLMPMSSRLQAQLADHQFVGAVGGLG